MRWTQTLQDVGFLSPWSFLSYTFWSAPTGQLQRFFHLILWWYDMKLHDITCTYMIMLQDVYSCIFMIYIHTYVCKTMLLYMQAKQDIHVFFPSSSPQRLPLADISWWITWISSSATMRERPICSMGVWYFFTIRTCKPIKCKPFIVGFFIHLGLPRLDIFGKWKLKLVALPEIKTKLRKNTMIMKI